MTRARGSLAAGILILATALALVFREANKPPAITTPAVAKKQARPSVNKESAAHTSPQILDLPPPSVSPDSTDAPETQEWVDSRVHELSDLAWFDDAESLKKILAELSNPNPEIRTAALAATREFGSREAVPYLQAIAEKSTNSAEKNSLAELIEFLNLPTVVEQLDNP
jgi:HEAT repeats